MVEIGTAIYYDRLENHPGRLATYDGIGAGLSFKFIHSPGCRGPYKKPSDLIEKEIHLQSLITMNSTVEKCTCTEEGYSPECPQAFFQGGEILHALNKNDRLKPRLYGKAPEAVPIPPHRLMLDNTRPKFSREDAYNQFLDPFELMSEASNSSVEDQIAGLENKLKADRKLSQPVRNQMGRGKLGNDVALMEQNREILRRFEALKIEEESLTSMSIGGYTVDLSKAAQKVKEVAPLPPSRLPLIFKDDDMNFFHHFFQGLEILMGREIFLQVVSETHYFKYGQQTILPLIEGMLKSGYERTDNEITVFTKKVLTSTFEVDQITDNNMENRMLIVAANLWGFQYIESGMQCKEADLRMWLSICYNHYRTIWFNTFKSAGIPAFALEGVQVRYEEPPQYSSRSSLVHPTRASTFPLTSSSLERIQESDSRSSRHRSSRQKKPKAPDSVIESFFGKKK
nr:hypothetical protein [Colletotrichum associated negative-sense single-stranded RNA virus 2]